MNVGSINFILRIVNAAFLCAVRLIVMTGEAFYYVSVIALVSAFLSGYFMGFIRLGNRVITLAIAATVSLFTYTFLAALFEYWSMAAEWAPVAAFLFIFFTIYTTLYFLSRKFLSIPPEHHRNIMNRILGGLGSTVIAGIFIVVLARLTGAVVIPENINLAFERAGINAFIDERLDRYAKNERSPLKIVAPGARETDEHFIALSFSTTEYAIRPVMEQEMLRLINAERAMAGVGPLKMDSSLTGLARAYSADMFTRGYFSHNTPEGVDPFQRMKKANIRYMYAGENLALAPTLMRAHTGLMNSPGHRANILQKAYKKVGIGILENKKYGLMISQEFKD